MIPRHPRHFVRVLLPILAAGVTGCVSPFHDHQSAGVVPKGKTEIAFGYSRPMVHDDAEGLQKVQDDVGVQLATGVSDQAEVRLRYEFIRLDDSESYHVVGLGPKFGLVPEQVALYLPVGSAFGNGVGFVETLSAHPTLIVSRRLSQGAELNLSGKGLIYFDEISESDVALNLGLALGSETGPFRLRPEVGVLFDTEDWRRIWQFGVGLSLRSRGQG